MELVSGCDFSVSFSFSRCDLSVAFRSVLLCELSAVLVCCLSLTVTVVLAALLWIGSVTGGAKDGLRVGSVGSGSLICVCRSAAADVAGVLAAFEGGSLALCVTVGSGLGELCATGASRATATARIAAVRAGLGDPFVAGVGLGGCVGCSCFTEGLTGAEVVAVKAGCGGLSLETGACCVCCSSRVGFSFLVEGAAGAETVADVTGRFGAW